MQYNSDADLVRVHLTLENGEIMSLRESKYPDPEGIIGRDQRTRIEYGNLFDCTFGRYERKRKIKIRVPRIFREEKGLVSPLYGQLYITNYYASNLNESYINMSFINEISASNVWPSQAVLLKEWKYYKEILLDYDTIDEQNA